MTDEEELSVADLVGKRLLRVGLIRFDGHP
ncbi:hypothetical protein P3T35_008140 [Kitasatospora sp. GP30]|nr:hypothetical protein [Kitasatospora sp. GP30]